MKTVPLANCALDSSWTWKHKLRFKLYPGRICELPNAPSSHRDCLVVRTGCELSFIDRLRVLVSGRLMVETKTVTENIIGDHKTESVAYPVFPKCLDNI